MSVFLKATAVAATVLVALSVIPLAEFALAALPSRGIRYVAADFRQPLPAVRPGAPLRG